MPTKTSWRVKFVPQLPIASIYLIPPNTSSLHLVEGTCCGCNKSPQQKKNHKTIPQTHSSRSLWFSILWATFVPHYWWSVKIGCVPFFFATAKHFGSACRLQQMKCVGAVAWLRFLISWVNSNFILINLSPLRGLFTTTKSIRSFYWSKASLIAKKCLWSVSVRTTIW